MDQTVRSLRSCGQLPIAGRGNSAAQLGAEHVARALIGVNAPAAAGAGEFARVWGDLPPTEIPANRALAECRTFLEMLAKALSDPGAKLGVKGVKINIDWPHAVIEMFSGDEIVLGDSESARRAGYAVTLTIRTVEFRVSVLRQIAIELARSRVAGQAAAAG